MREETIGQRTPILRLHPRQREKWHGVTSDLVGRVYTHRNDLVDGFTRRHGVHDLVYFEHHEAVESAIIREKQLKKWNRAWKIELLEQANPQWLDLYHSIAEV